MKSSTDPRHQKRREVLKLLFAEGFAHQQETNTMVEKIRKDEGRIDLIIQKSAPAWPVDKLNRIDLAILRLAIYEMRQKTAPPKVIIDEAVELAKEYGSENSPSFINGVLGTVYKKISK
jgi:N utilization substance protein B